MTQPQVPWNEPPPAGSVTSSGSLEDYFRENRATLTEEVLTAKARQAGHSEEAIRSAWAAVGAQPPPAGGRAVRWIAIAYGITFGLLSLGMLLNSSQSRGLFMPDAGAGIAILAGSLVAVFVASLIWIASRRAFWTLAAVFVGLQALSYLSYGGVEAILLLAGSVAILWFLWRPGWREVGTRADLSVLLAMPILLLLGVAGTCVASGLPIPGGR